MIIALKHDNTTLMGLYENIVEFAYCNFHFKRNEDNNIVVTSKHFDSYINKELISTISFNDNYTDEEAIRQYITYYIFKDDLKRYSISIYKVDNK